MALDSVVLHLCLTPAQRASLSVCLLPPAAPTPYCASGCSLTFQALGISFSLPALLAKRYLSEDGLEDTTQDLEWALPSKESAAC